MRLRHMMLCAVAASQILWGHAVAAGGDAEAGRKKTVTCNGCHAQSGMQSVPNLGGQSAAYFIAAMRAYQDGKRAHSTMRDVAKSYSDKELKNFAAYYVQFRAVAEDAVTEAPPAATACVSCHGAQGYEPANVVSPVLAGQKAAFLKLTLQEYRDGSRKHAIMQPIAAALTDADIDAVAGYFSSIKGLVVK